MKYAVIALLCAALLFSAAEAEVWTVSRPESGDRAGFAVIIREDGTALTPTDAYRAIRAITPEGTPEADRLYLAEALSGGAGADPKSPEASVYAGPLAALLDGAGRPLTGFDFADLRYACDRVLFTLPDDTMGVMDARGNVLLSGRYANIQPNGEGGYLALALGEYDIYQLDRYPVIYLDENGAAVETGLFAPPGGIGDFCGGICAISDADDGAEHRGESVFADGRGQALFGRGFDYASGFIGSLAWVSVEGRCGLIDRQGRFALEPVYDDITSARSAAGDIYIAVRGNTVSVIDAETGDTLFGEGFDTTSVYAQLENPNLLRVSADGGSGLYALDGTQVLALPEGRELSCAFSVACEGVPDRVVESRGEWPFRAAQLLDMALNPVGGYFQELSGAIWREGRGLYVVQSYRVNKDEAGFYDIDWESWRYGVCDQDGNTVLDSVYERLEVLSENRFWVIRDGRCGLIDADGNWLFAVDG